MPDPNQRRHNKGFHPDNIHQGAYDFEALVGVNSALRELLFAKPDGTGLMLDFADPEAVQLLNQSLLRRYYGIHRWTLPSEQLCPGVPGRVDYLHYLSDLMTASNMEHVKLLDIGTGANGIYALLAAAHFKWKVIACDTNATSLGHLSNILQQNPQLENWIELRLQQDPGRILNGILAKGEHVTATVCNPPFYDSTEQAQLAHFKKHDTHVKRGLASHPENRAMSGISEELTYPGGEVAFVSKLIGESLGFADQVDWFTSLVSKSSSLDPLLRKLSETGVAQQRILSMRHGNKISRIFCWSFKKL